MGCRSKLNLVVEFWDTHQVEAPNLVIVVCNDSPRNGIECLVEFRTPSLKTVYDFSLLSLLVHLSYISETFFGRDGRFNILRQFITNSNLTSLGYYRDSAKISISYRFIYNNAAILLSTVALKSFVTMCIVYTVLFICFNIFFILAL